MSEFWMVWNPNGRAPTHKHRTLVEAEREAQRLARMIPGESFVILEAMHAYRISVAPVQKIALSELDEIPF